MKSFRISSTISATSPRTTHGHDNSASGRASSHPRARTFALLASLKITDKAGLPIDEVLARVHRAYTRARGGYVLLNELAAELDVLRAKHGNVPFSRAMLRRRSPMPKRNADPRITYNAAVLHQCLNDTGTARALLTEIADTPVPGTAKRFRDLAASEPLWRGATPTM